jgi:hypothetical protein
MGGGAYVASQLSWPQTVKIISTKPLPTGVDRIWGMAFQVLKYDVFDNGTVCGRKEPSSPEMFTPVAPFQLRNVRFYRIA